MFERRSARDSVVGLQKMQHMLRNIQSEDNSDDERNLNFGHQSYFPLNN